MDTREEKLADAMAVPAGSAILRAFRILEALGEFDDPPQLAGIAQAVNLPGPTVLRMVESTRIVADLAAVRQNGYAVDNGEFLQGISCVAMPVRNLDEKVVAAVAISVPGDRVGVREMMDCLPAMRSAAQALTATIDW